jgi:hypothetical protein
MDKDINEEESQKKTLRTCGICGIASCGKLPEKG